MTITRHAVRAFLPEPRRRRVGTALCLSGGGFRAALFHLGALRRLNELGALSRVDAVSSVSGGSIMAAHLADRLSPWPPAGSSLSPAEWNRRVAEPFYAFAARDIRTRPVLTRALPWNWLRETTGVETLASLYEARLTTLRLPALPERPDFTLCATDMSYGVNWIFRRGEMGDYQAGYQRPAPSWPLARAVAASSCFPPIFNPLRPDVEPDALKGGKAPRGPDRDACIRGLRLTDGGTYDNMGLEPVWKSAQTVLVSDGGATFDFAPDRWLLSRLSRYTQIQSAQAQSLRKRWLMANFSTGVMSGTYWSVGSCTANYGERFWGYSEDLVDEVVSEVRTDMDGFSEAEIQILENHGYSLAEAAMQTHARDLIIGAAEPFRLPHQRWQNEGDVAKALSQSHRRFARAFFRWLKG
jgi:NTE family protein